MKVKVEDKENIKEKESYLCKVCKHYNYCIIRRYGYVSYCEYFDLKKEEEESLNLNNLPK